MATRIFMAFPGFKKKAFTMSYDDGVAQDKRLIAIMQKYGLKGTFNINSDLFGDTPGQEKGRMPENEAIELYTSSGNEVAVHGARHVSLSMVDSAVAVNDVIEDRKNLEKLLKKPVKGMAYANGSGATNKKVAQMMKDCGILYSRTTDSSHSFALPETLDDWLLLPATCHHNDPQLFELGKKFAERTYSEYFWSNAAQMFYLWGHSYEFDTNDNWERMEQFAQYIGGREDIWYATNMEIYQYVRAYDMLEWTVDGGTVYNPTNTDIYVDYYKKKVLIQAGKTVNLNEAKGL